MLKVSEKNKNLGFPETSLHCAAPSSAMTMPSMPSIPTVSKMRVPVAVRMVVPKVRRGRGRHMRRVARLVRRHRRRGRAVHVKHRRHPAEKHRREHDSGKREPVLAPMATAVPERTLLGKVAVLSVLQFARRVSEIFKLVSRGFAFLLVDFFRVGIAFLAKVVVDAGHALVPMSDNRASSAAVASNPTPVLLLVVDMVLVLVRVLLSAGNGASNLLDHHACDPTKGIENGGNRVVRIISVFRVRVIVVTSFGIRVVDKHGLFIVSSLLHLGVGFERSEAGHLARMLLSGSSNEVLAGESNIELESLGGVARELADLKIKKIGEEISVSLVARNLASRLRPCLAYTFFRRRNNHPIPIFIDICHLKLLAAKAVELADPRFDVGPGGHGRVDADATDLACERGLD